MHHIESPILTHSAKPFFAHTLLAAFLSPLRRHRWAATSVGALSLFGMVAAFGIAPPNSTDIRSQSIVETLTTHNASALALANNLFFHEDWVQAADTVGAILARLGVQDAAALAFLRSNASAQLIFRQLRPGKIISSQTDDSGALLSLNFPLNDGRTLVVSRQGNGFQVGAPTFTPKILQIRKSAVIKSSLFAATDDAGIPDAIATQMADIFAGDIDFQRDLRQGDRFSLVYELLTVQGQAVRSGRILAAEFTNQNKTYHAIFNPDSQGRGSYYSSEGKSLRKAFLRSPLEFTRVTSGFTTARFHPILQQWRAHKGVDYGAPSGTRVRATADGSIDFIGQQGGYGKLLLIKHQGRYATAYGHLSAFASGLRQGSHVRQGDIIGYVGQSGWATGPHLHYEFRINGSQVNPLGIALPEAPPLDAPQLAKFQQTARPLLNQLQQLSHSQVASSFE